MSVTTEIALFPLDKGEHVSEYVSKVVAYIRDLQIPYQLTAMGTIYETENLDLALNIISGAYEILEPHSNRVYCTAKFDINKLKNNALQSKVDAVEKRIGNVKR